VSTKRPDVGDQLRKARLAVGISQVTLAQHTGYSERAIQSWERNERTPRLKHLIRLASTLGQEVAFFYGSDDPSDTSAAA
jgi:transcriptional regulator with XRE-family HTH domain